MPDRVILDSSVIAAIFFKEESSERAERVAENYRLTTVDLAIAAASEREKVPLLTTDGKLYEKVKSKRSVKLI
jgi:predicted nucleic acid-binding protein